MVLTRDYFYKEERVVVIQYYTCDEKGTNIVQTEIYQSSSVQ